MLHLPRFPFISTEEDSLAFDLVKTHQAETRGQVQEFPLMF